MAKRARQIPRLPEGELEILQMLWRESSVTIQQAQTALGQPIGYTTVQTRLNRLVDKGLVARSTTRPAHYSAAVTPEQVHARELETLVDRVTNGSVVPLVAHLINRKSISPGELAELKKLVADAERRGTKGSKGEGRA